MDVGRGAWGTGTPIQEYIFIKDVRSPRRDMQKKILSRAHEIASIGNEIAFRYHETLSRGNEIFSLHVPSRAP